MKGLKKIVAALLCLGMIGTFSACDMETLLKELGNFGFDPSLSTDSSESSDDKEENVLPITEEEWIAAITATVEATNVTQSMYYTYEYSNGKPNRKIESNMKLANNTTYQWGTQDGESYQQYYANIDGVNYKYSYSGGVWERQELNYEIKYDNSQMESVFAPIKENFGEFQFDETGGYYYLSELTISSGNEIMFMYNIEVRIKEGKVSQFNYEVDVTDSENNKIGKVKPELKYWDYGATIVTLPEINE